jgi:hypothetical protein
MPVAPSAAVQDGNFTYFGIFLIILELVLKHVTVYSELPCDFCRQESRPQNAQLSACQQRR